MIIDFFFLPNNLQHRCSCLRDFIGQKLRQPHHLSERVTLGSDAQIWLSPASGSQGCLCKYRLLRFTPHPTNPSLRSGALSLYFNKWLRQMFMHIEVGGITLSREKRPASITDAVSAALGFPPQLRRTQIPLAVWAERGRAGYWGCPLVQWGGWRNENSCCRKSDSTSARVG